MLISSIIAAATSAGSLRLIKFSKNLKFDASFAIGSQRFGLLGSPTMQALSTHLLQSAIERKLHLLRTIKHMTLRQMSLIQEQDVDALLVLLNQKNEAMRSLAEVQAKLLPFQNDGADSRTWDNPNDKATAKSNLQECNRLIAELMEMENHSINNLSRDQRIVATQLKQVHSSLSVDRAYSDASVDADSQLSLSLEG